MSDRQGVDVASYQGPPGEWRGVAGRIGWAAVKITELEPPTPTWDGHYVNPDADADWRDLRARRLGRIAYAYGHPNVSAADSAAFFVAELSKLGIEDADAVALDIEETDGKTPAEVAQWCREFLAAVQKALSRLPLAYSYPNFIETGNLAGCERYPLWISDPNHPAGHPVVPRPWKTWAIHQYGISGQIDRDIIAYADTEEMADALGKRGTQPVHRTPRPPKPKRHVVRKTVHKARKVVRHEPVMTAASANSAIAAAVVWWVHHLGLHLTVTQQGAILTIVTALAGMAAAIATRPVRMTAFVAALGTAATASAAFGLHYPPWFIGGETPLIALGLGVILRGQVSPAALLAEAEAALAPPLTPLPPAVPAAPGGAG